METSKSFNLINPLNINEHYYLSKIYFKIKSFKFVNETFLKCLNVYAWLNNFFNKQKLTNGLCNQRCAGLWPTLSESWSAFWEFLQDFPIISLYQNFLRSKYGEENQGRPFLPMFSYQGRLFFPMYSVWLHGSLVLFF